MPAQLTSIIAPYWSHTAKLLVVTSCSIGTVEDNTSARQSPNSCAGHTKDKPFTSALLLLPSSPAALKAQTCWASSTPIHCSNTVQLHTPMLLLLLLPNAHLHIEHEAGQLLRCDGAIVHHAATQQQAERNAGRLRCSASHKVQPPCS